MASILEQTGLLQNDELILDISASDFKTVLESNLDPPGYKLFEVFSKSKNSYKGIIDEHSFTLYEKRSLFQLRSALVTIKGDYKEDNQKTVISFEVNGLNIYLILVYFFFFIFYCFGFSVIYQISNEQIATQYKIYFSLALLAHMFLQTSAPVIAKKKKVSKFKNNLSGILKDMIANHKFNSKSDSN